MHYIKFNIIVVGDDNLDKCIESIKRQNYPKDLVKYYLQKDINICLNNTSNNWTLVIDSRVIFIDECSLEKLANYIYKKGKCNKCDDYYITWKNHVCGCAINDCCDNYNIAFPTICMSIVGNDLCGLCNISCLLDEHKLDCDLTQIKIKCHKCEECNKDTNHIPMNSYMRAHRRYAEIDNKSIIDPHVIELNKIHNEMVYKLSKRRLFYVNN